MSNDQGISYQTVTDFSKQLDGIEYIVLITSDGFPLAYVGISEEKAEAAAALAVDLHYGSSEAAKDLLGRLGLEVIVDVGDGTVIDVRKVKNTLLLIKGDRGPVSEAIKAIVRYLNGLHVYCPYCQSDLTLEKYRCEHCGKSIPFTSERCPHCGKDVYYKKCPNCGRITTSKGERVKLVKDRSDTIFSIFEGVLAAAVIGGYTYMISSDIVLGVGAGVISGGLVTGLLYNRARFRYQIAKD